jgi:DNA polymerase V
MLALADCNNFYASCERLFQPKLRDKPVVVLSNNDGCVIARSNEAKAIGIKMGEPAFKIKAIIEQKNVHVFSTNFALYGDLSKRVMNTLRSEVSKMEVYSIDEAFMSFEGEGSPEEKALMIKQKVAKYVGIPVSIGVAPTKALCKVANHIAKKHTKTGVFLLNDEKLIERALKWFPVEELWGVGRRYAKKFKSMGIHTAWDLCQLDDNWIRRNLTVGGLKLVKELKGEQCFPLEETAQRKKSICTARSFGKEVSTLNELREAVSNHANTCAKKLRKERSCCNKVTVFLSTNPFKPQAKQYYGTKTFRFSTPTNDSFEIVEAAMKMLERIYRDDCIYKKAGVIVGETVPEEQVQLNLFDSIDREKRKAINQAVDQINNRIGRDKVKLAVQGYGRKWRLKQERLSPCYSTRLDEALVVRV